MTIQCRIHARSGILGAYLIMNESGRHDQTPQTAHMGCKWFSVKEFDIDESLVVILGNYIQQPSQHIIMIISNVIEWVGTLLWLERKMIICGKTLTVACLYHILETLAKGKIDKSEWVHQSLTK